MKGHSAWSYRPYRPLLTEVGDPYICRVVPSEYEIHFEWLEDDGTYEVFYRVRGATDFLHYATTRECFCDITGLDCGVDYEFYVTCGETRSRVRLARTGKAEGVVVNYLHPDDEAYSFSGHFLCSPSLLRHPDGYLLSSMDVFGHGDPQNLTMIFRSDDDGETWHYVSELMPCFWGKLFLHKGELYMLSCSTEYGDLLIGKSTDGGKTFSAPVVLLRGSNGKNGNSGVHKNPQNILRHRGRLYNTLEWGAWANKDYCHAAMVMSCDENDDLLDPNSWHFTEPVKFAHFAPEVSDLPLCTMTIEGTLVLDPQGKLLNIMRFGKFGRALVYAVDEENPDAPLTYSRLMPFPANYSKFMIKFDPVSNFYYSVGTMAYDPNNVGTRNWLCLLRSRDLESWETVCSLLDYRHEDPAKIGFQYVDFEIEGEDMIFLCRTALNGAACHHDTNYQTFHRIKDFRSL